MKQAFRTFALSANLLGTVVLLRPPTAWAQARPTATARPHDTPTDTARARRYAKFPAPILLKQPDRRSTANRNGVCDLLTNGDFEIQTLGPGISGPSRVNNLGGGISGSTIDNAAPMGSECSGWTSPTLGTPDYYASNASNIDVSPSDGLFAQFTPYGKTGGCVGLGTFESTTRDGHTDRRVTEYVSTQVPGLSAGKYYGSFRVQLSNGGRKKLEASNTGVASGFGFQISNGPLSPVVGTGPTEDFLTPSGRGVLTSNPLSTYDVGLWSYHTGLFDVVNGDQTLTIGLFNTSLADRMRYPINGSTSATSTAPPYVRSYFLVDDVQLFRIPTAGPNITCMTSPVTIGEGCEIPGFTYEWRISGQSAVLSNSLRMTVRPSVTTTYTLTVILPAHYTFNNTIQSSTTVTACPSVSSTNLSSICLGSSMTFTANPSQNVAWSTSPSGAFTPSSGYGPSFTTTAAAGTSGNVSANFVNAPGGPTITQPVTFVNATPPNLSAYFDVDARRIFAEVTPVAGATYRWYKDGVLHTTNHNPSVTWAIPRGECKGYEIRVEAVFDCGTSPQAVAYVGGANDCEEWRAMAYPNPASSLLAVPANAREAVLINSQGTIVRKLSSGGGLDVQTLPTGLYTLRMRQDGKIINQRIEVKH